MFLSFPAVIFCYSSSGPGVKLIPVIGHSVLCLPSYTQIMLSLYSCSQVSNFISPGSPQWVYSSGHFTTPFSKTGLFAVKKLKSARLPQTLSPSICPRIMGGIGSDCLQPTLVSLCPQGSPFVNVLPLS